MKQLKLCIGLLMLAVAVCAAWQSPRRAAAAQDIQFNRDIRPLLKGHRTPLGSKRKAMRNGQSGMWLSELLPHYQKIVDEVCWLRGMSTDVFNHGPAKLFMNTGFQAPGRPSFGAWAIYGLGSESTDLPGFVVLQSGPRGPRTGSTLWSSGFLPTSFQGVPFRSQGGPILNLRSPNCLSRERERDFLTDVHGRVIKEVLA